MKRILLISSVLLSLFCSLLYSQENITNGVESDDLTLTDSGSVSFPLLDSLLADSSLIIEMEITSNGDTLYKYRYAPFDFGAVNTDPPTLYPNNSVESNGPQRSPTARVQTINTSKAIGKIDFSEGVTPSGGKTYSIPIPTAPVNSLSPQVALVYNSQSGNGVAGFGWNLSGVSSITVAQKNNYYDNGVSPIDLTQPSQLAFSLDGIRLVLNSIITGYEYETAQGFVSVKKQMSGSHIAYFEARYPNGNQAVFGFKSNTTTRFSYPITELTDSKGYKIFFEYTQSGNNYYVDKIKYGGKNTTDQLAELRFTYATRTDYVPVYIGGGSLFSKSVAQNSFNIQSS